MRNFTGRLLLSCAALCSLSGVAMAQEVNAQANARVGTPPLATVVNGASDHNAMVGRLAVGYLGRRSISIANPVPGGALPTVEAPVIGVRYWLSEMLGIDAGIGFFLQSGSTQAPGGPNQDKQSYNGFLLHAGVPLALANSGHFSFQIVPEANVGFAGSEIDPPAPAPNIELNGFHLDIGARAGAEIHFGFMNIPQLSLQGSVGLRFAMDNTSGDAAGQDFSDKTTTLETTVGDNPWNIFTSNVAALYYF